MELKQIIENQVRTHSEIRNLENNIRTREDELRLLNLFVNRERFNLKRIRAEGLPFRFRKDAYLEFAKAVIRRNVAKGRSFFTKLNPRRIKLTSHKKG